MCATLPAVAIGWPPAHLLVNRKDSNIVKNGFAQRAIARGLPFRSLGSTRHPHNHPAGLGPTRSDSASTLMLMARLSGAKTLARKPGCDMSCDVTGLPVSRNLRTREPRSPILASGVSRIAPVGTLSDGTERTAKSSSRANVPLGSGRAATKYPTVGGAGAGVFSVTCTTGLGGSYCCRQ